MQVSLQDWRKQNTAKSHSQDLRNFKYQHGGGGAGVARLSRRKLIKASQCLMLERDSEKSEDNVSS